MDGMKIQIGPSPVEGILGCFKFRRAEKGFRFTATSLPGHLIHFVVSGHVRQQCNGREYELRPGTIHWYHEDEWVVGEVQKGPWEFYSIGFVAPTYPPPDFTQRQFFPDRAQTERLFEATLKAWNDASLAPLQRTFRVHGGLLRILSMLTTPSQQPRNLDPRARVWWDLETEIRRNLQRVYDLVALAEISGRSPATIARSCLYAVGEPPMKRIKHVRLGLARGLVKRSALTMSEIADRVGYARVHEFSRDYRKRFGLPPTADRAAGRGVK